MDDSIPDNQLDVGLVFQDTYVAQRVTGHKEEIRNLARLQNPNRGIVWVE